MIPKSNFLFQGQIFTFYIFCVNCIYFILYSFHPSNPYIMKKKQFIHIWLPTCLICKKYSVAKIEWWFLFVCLDKMCQLRISCVFFFWHLRGCHIWYGWVATEKWGNISGTEIPNIKFCNISKKGTWVCFKKHKMHSFMEFSRNATLWQ